MRYTLDGVGYSIDAKDFLLYNLAEEFDKKPSYEELLGMFRGFVITFPGLSNADELMQAIYSVFSDLDLVCSCEEYDQIWDTLESMVVAINTEYTVGELDDYHHWTAKELAEDWA